MTIAALHSLFLQHPQICTDTRNIVQNSLFFALKGDNFDANNFASDALEKGCSYAIVDNPKIARNNHYIVVENVLKTLQELANYHRKHCKAKVLAITGTNGKTTTKELIKSVLATTYETIATEGNFNNHIGVPLTLLHITKKTEIAIVEMGASNLNEISELCAIAEPDYGIITNVGTGHIEGFGSFEGVVKTKTELYEALAQKGGTIFVNSDDSILSEKAKNYECPIFSYGTKEAQVQGNYLSSTPLLKAVLENTEIETHLLGAYNFENVLAAYAIGKFFKIDKQKAFKALSDYSPNNNRSQLLKTKTNTIILDAYNANPTSMRAAILNFAAIEYPNKRLILGDMLELGGVSKSSHKLIKELLQEQKLDTKTWLVGKHFSYDKCGNFTYFDTTQEVTDYLKQNPITESQILIKGSRGIKLESLVNTL